MGAVDLAESRLGVHSQFCQPDGAKTVFLPLYPVPVGLLGTGHRQVLRDCRQEHEGTRPGQHEGSHIDTEGDVVERPRQAPAALLADRPAAGRLHPPSDPYRLGAPSHPPAYPVARTPSEAQSRPALLHARGRGAQPAGPVPRPSGVPRRGPEAQGARRGA